MICGPHACRDCAISTVGIIIYIPIAFAGAVVATPLAILGGLPYLAYQNHKVNKVREEVKRLSNEISNHWDNRNNDNDFRSFRKLGHLYKRYERVVNYHLTIDRLKKAERILRDEREKLHRIIIVIAHVAINLIPVIGLFISVSIVDYRLRRYFDDLRERTFQIPHGNPYYVNLSHLIDLIGNAIARADTFNAQLLLRKERSYDKEAAAKSGRRKANTALPEVIIRKVQSFLATTEQLNSMQPELAKFKSQYLPPKPKTTTEFRFSGT